jgi:hypothetical protein
LTDNPRGPSAVLFPFSVLRASPPAHLLGVLHPDGRIEKNRQEAYRVEDDVRQNGFSEHDGVERDRGDGPAVLLAFELQGF